MIKHPAKYSDCLMQYLAKYLQFSKLILDPFAGTGKLKQIRSDAILLEIEPEWAKINKAIVGDAQFMPFKNNMFDAICTSPTYGNRMADHFVDHQVSKKYVRHTYRHYLGRKLNENNSGKMQWGKKYQLLHFNSYKECKRVLKHNGLFVLNISDHIRASKQVYVSEWHKDTLCELDFKLIKHYKINTPRNKHGRNYKSRLDYENIYIFRKGN